MTAATLQGNRSLAGALLALAMLLNGAAAPAAAAAPAPADHGAHHGHDGMTDGAPAGDAAESQDDGCCQQADCACGCAAPSVAAARPIAVARGPFAPAIDDTPVHTLHALRPSGTPFRPPA